jgi:hypothetical protein
MKERPILFSGEMVRAILDGRKGQTRRVVKPQPPHSDRVLRAPVEIEPGRAWGQEGQFIPVAYTVDCSHYREPILCPYGEVGDRLWVRETWQYALNVTNDPGMHSFNNCKTNPATGEKYIIYYRAMYNEHDDPRGWSSPIHMPRWASRITLEITDIRVERLQDISEEDARAEGFSVTERAGIDSSFGNAIARAWFRGLWDSINAKRGHSWASNPWVWVIAFKQVESEVDQ